MASEQANSMRMKHQEHCLCYSGRVSVSKHHLVVAVCAGIQDLRGSLASHFLFFFLSYFYIRLDYIILTKYIILYYINKNVNKTEAGSRVFKQNKNLTFGSRYNYRKEA